MANYINIVDCKKITSDKKILLILLLFDKNIQKAGLITGLGTKHNDLDILFLTDALCDIVIQDALNDHDIIRYYAEYFKELNRLLLEGEDFESLINIRELILLIDSEIEGFHSMCY